MKNITRSKRLVTIIYTIAILLVTTTIGIGVYDFNTKDGFLTIDDKKLEVTTKKNTVSELLQEQDIKIKEEDYINIALDEKIKSEFDIKIKTAKPIKLNFKDRELEIKTTEKTVEDVLKSLSIDYDENDIITPELDAEIEKDIEITLIEVEEKIHVVREEIDYKTETKNNSNLERGKTLTQQQGIRGIKENRIKEVYKNGSLVSKEIIESNVVREPVNKIVQNGTKTITVASRGGRTAPAAQASASLQGKTSMTMNASAYDLSYQSTRKNPGDPGYGITASGTKARPGVVAVDRSVIPLGTKLYIKFPKPYEHLSGQYSAEDVGGAIKGNKIDIFLESGTRQFGRRNVEVYILD